jgi:hypothetical protein
MHLRDVFRFTVNIREILNAPNLDINVGFLRRLRRMKMEDGRLWDS